AGLEPAFAEILAQGADAMLVLADRVFLHNREPILAFAAEHRRPVMSAYRELAEGGGLMSFGPSYAAMHRQAARYVDKILKGEKPAELPIEQPARFELVINLKSAKALGISVPPTLLARADEVIE
ncbi:MAG: ABC transporter substrate binding protein, partial [Microvirga sp.]